MNIDVLHALFDAVNWFIVIATGAVVIGLMAAVRKLLKKRDDVGDDIQ